MPAPKKILHVEDNFENRILVRRLLHASGFELIEAENAVEALELLKKHQPTMRVSCVSGSSSMMAILKKSVARS